MSELPKRPKNPSRENRIRGALHELESDVRAGYPHTMWRVYTGDPGADAAVREALEREATAAMGRQPQIYAELELRSARHVRRLERRQRWLAFCMWSLLLVGVLAWILG